jgi:predicted component of type VI protein secretion system
MDVKLVVAGGKNAGKEVPVAGPKFFIGRAEDCHLRPQSDQVSRHHAAILIDPGYVAVRDLGSRNGTFVNDQRVTREQELKNGDRLKFGPLEFTVELAVSMSGQKKPKVKDMQEAAARAAEAGAKPDLDIFKLLGEAETAQNRSISETISIPIVPNLRRPKTPPPPPPPIPAESADADEEPKKPEKPISVFGEAPKKKKEVVPDGTRSAAAEALRQFINRKQ